MTEKKIKTREEWKLLINKLNYPDFQNLVRDLLKAYNFNDIRQRGSGPDGGRDLEATFCFQRPNGEKQFLTCWIQCKKQDRGVSFSQVHEDITRASSVRIDEYYIISNFDTTPDCKDEFEKGSKTWHCKIVDWSGLKFQDILFAHPDICRYYFPDEEVPPIVDIKSPKEIMDLSSDLGKHFRIKLELKTDKKINVNNPSEVAEVLKDSLLKLQYIDINLRALIYQKISIFFLSLEKPYDAIMFLDKSLEITPRNIEALLNKGYILGKIDEIEDSNNCYDEILKLDSSNKFALNNKASNLKRVGRFKEALPLIDRVLEKDPSFILAIINKANILKGLKKSKEALDFLNGIGELFEKSTMLQATKVELCIDMLDLKRARDINEIILKKDPKNIDALNSRGVIYEKNSRFQNKEKYLQLSLSSFENVIESDDEYPLGWSNKVVILINSGMFKEASEILNTAYSIFPKNPHVLKQKGILALCNKNPRDALKYFTKALKLLFDEDFLVNRGKAELLLRQWGDAKNTAESLLKYNPESSNAWAIKGEALRKLRQLRLANMCFKNADKYKEKPISLLE